MPPVRDSGRRNASVAAALLFAGVVAVYAWLATFGQWTSWPATTAYYSQLAEAFCHGQLSFLERPHPALLALPNPYDPRSRGRVRYPWDAALYNGKFYSYWGPVPALVLAAIRPFYPWEVGDQVVAFAFLCATVMFLLLLILRMWQRLFPTLNWLYVLPGLILAGLANPLPWLASRPAVYESAIAAGQCFLVAGLLSAFCAVEEDRLRIGLLALASGSWILAVGSRAPLLGATGFLLVVLAVRVFRACPHGGRLALAAVALAAPFLVGLVGLGCYNNTRFGSWLELGHRYQLSKLNQRDLYGQMIAPGNIPPNLHNYLVNPFRLLPTFPFVKPDTGHGPLLSLLPAPPIYYSELVTGLIPAVPYVAFAAIPLGLLLRQGWRAGQRLLRPRAGIVDLPTRGLREWTELALSGSSLLTFLPLLLFFCATMRYLGDAVPSCILLATLGVWRGAERWGDDRGAFAAFVWVVTMLSAAIGVLLGVTGYDARIEKLNPALFESLSLWLAP